MIFFYISLSTYVCFSILKYKQALNVLKQNKFKIKDYGKWIVKNYKRVFLNKELLSILLIVIALNFNVKIIGICTVIFYTLMFLLDFKKVKKLKIDNKTIYRIITILLIFIALNIWFILDYMSYHNADIVFDNTAFYYIILYIVSYLSYFVLWLANVLAKPLDKLSK